MAFHEVSRETVRAPQYATRTVTVTSKAWGSYSANRSTKTPTGDYVEKTFVTWRCGNCRALAVGTESDAAPAKCMKCHC